MKIGAFLSIVCLVQNFLVMADKKKIGRAECGPSPAPWLRLWRTHGDGAHFLFSDRTQIKTQNIRKKIKNIGEEPKGGRTQNNRIQVQRANHSATESCAALLTIADSCNEQRHHIDLSAWLAS